MKKLRTKIRRRQAPESSVPSTRITNDTVAEHREEVLGRARKYIYPLRHTKHRLVVISVWLIILAVVIFFTYCTLALYKFKSSSQFLYKVTQVIPFPVARTGSDFVAYENYLFEVNHYMHYYRTQQELDLNSEAGKQQMAEFKRRALDKVITDAYIKKLAEAKGVSVSNREVDDRIEMVRSQNRLGANDQEFRSVLKDYWNWSENDFKRSLKSQILSEKVASAYDTGAHDRANAAVTQLKNGKDFAALASEVSEDPSSKTNGGEYGFPIEQTNRDISPLVVEKLFQLKDGEYSDVIDVGYGLEIVKNIQTQSDGKLRAAHIVFNFKNVDEYVNEKKDQEKARAYIRF